MQIMAVYNCFCCLNPPKWPLISWVSIFQLCGSSDGQTILLLVWSSMCLKSIYIYIYIIQYVHCMSYVQYVHPRCLPMQRVSSQLQMVGLEPGAGQQHPGQDGAARSGLVLRLELGPLGIWKYQKRVGKTRNMLTWAKDKGANKIMKNY